MVNLEKLLPDDCNNIVNWNQNKDADYLIQWSGFNTFLYPVLLALIAKRLMNIVSLVIVKIRINVIITEDGTTLINECPDIIR